MAKETFITHDRVKERLNYNQDTGKFIWISHNQPWLVGKEAGCHKGCNGYTRIMIEGESFYAHRLAWFYMTGEWPNCEIDHKDRNRINNKWDNLREATPAKNSQNTKKRRDNTSGHRGVDWSKANGVWRARASLNGKVRSLGTFSNKLDASKAYEKFALSNYGDFAGDM